MLPQSRSLPLDCRNTATCCSMEPPPHVQNVFLLESNMVIKPDGKSSNLLMTMTSSAARVLLSPIMVYSINFGNMFRTKSLFHDKPANTFTRNVCFFPLVSLLYFYSQYCMQLEHAELSLADKQPYQDQTTWNLLQTHYCILLFITSDLSPVLCFDRVSLITQTICVRRPHTAPYTWTQ